ncbi:hypothetical protein ACRALDRAFT_1064027 [Sodiomyces alcalophilus JCM 7366]|uniref:uncharacterized protein n=1 Tax=Sodiomyces alcalophilus JCM 7366 TaxID=591952 RepID=UPI0039B46C73
MASSPDTAPQISPGDHRGYMQYALSLAKQSPPKPSNYRVGAVLVDRSTNTVLSTGYTLELPGNTHAEQCCFAKLAERHGVAEEQLADAMASAGSGSLALYTTMEPCSQRLSGNLPCAQRILRLRRLVGCVYVGVREPEKFVSENTGRKTLEEAGIEFVHVEGLEREILEVATAGHVR